MNLIILYSMFIALIITVILLINSCYDSKETWNDRTKEECDIVSYGTYEDFLFQMNKPIWVRDNKYPKSFFHKDHDFTHWYVHANIFIFDGIGMIFKREDHKLVEKWLNEHEIKETVAVINDYNWRVK